MSSVGNLSSAEPAQAVVWSLGQLALGQVTGGLSLESSRGMEQVRERIRKLVTVTATTHSLPNITELCSLLLKSAKHGRGGGQSGKGSEGPPPTRLPLVCPFRAGVTRQEGLPALGHTRWSNLGRRRVGAPGSSPGFWTAKTERVPPGGGASCHPPDRSRGRFWLGPFILLPVAEEGGGVRGGGEPGLRASASPQKLRAAGPQGAPGLRAPPLLTYRAETEP